MPTYKTPGVYVQEISTLAPSIAEVETAIPAFIGFTNSGDKNVPVRIKSMVDYQMYFGGAEPEKSITVTISNDPDTQTDTISNVTVDNARRSRNVLYYAMQLYFANGGGPCYIVPVGNYGESATAGLDMYKAALEAANREDEPTLLVFPDAPYIIPKNYYDLVIEAMQQASTLGDRFVIIDVLNADTNKMDDAVKAFRDKGIPVEQARYGAAYYPYLKTTIPYIYDENSITINGSARSRTAPAVVTVTEPPAGDGDGGGTGGTRRGRAGAAGTEPAAAGTTSFANLLNATQNLVKQKIMEYGVELTPAAAVAGVYARVDNSRGVWKAPANESLVYVSGPATKITDDDQASLNIDVEAGKSINAIRSFVGKGTKIWGARTLAGNDNEWRFINVRRLFNMIEESVKKSTNWAVFEPNDANTWTRVRSMIENYLILKWKDGALAGAKPNEAFYVQVGLNQTMTSVDILEGRMIVEIGLAAVRPAEFIVLKFSHKLQTS